MYLSTLHVLLEIYFDVIKLPLQRLLCELTLAVKAHFVYTSSFTVVLVGSLKP